MSSNSDHKNSISEANNVTTNAGNCCSKASSELKLYQAFIFSVPIFFTFILLFLFYLFYLRRRRVNWASLRMRAGDPAAVSAESGDEISRCELGLKKEIREMLPVIIFSESFSVKDNLCSVCLGEYQAEDKLQQIPTCEHTFHMECIDLWLTKHSTCPLCRKSLLVNESCPNGTENDSNSSNAQNGDEASHQNDLQNNGDPQSSELSSDRTILNDDERDEATKDVENAKSETGGC